MGSFVLLCSQRNKPNKAQLSAVRSCRDDSKAFPARLAWGKSRCRWVGSWSHHRRAVTSVSRGGRSDAYFVSDPPGCSFGCELSDCRWSDLLSSSGSRNSQEHTLFNCPLCDGLLRALGWTRILSNTGSDHGAIRDDRTVARQGILTPEFAESCGDRAVGNRPSTLSRHWVRALCICDRWFIDFRSSGL